MNSILAKWVSKNAADWNDNVASVGQNLFKNPLSVWLQNQ